MRYIGARCALCGIFARATPSANFAPNSEMEMGAGDGDGMEFGDGIRRWLAEPKMEMGAGFPEQSASTLSMNHAGLFRQENSLATDSPHKSLEFAEVAATTRRWYGSRSGGSRQDGLIAEEAVGPSGSDEDEKACATYEKAKKQGAGQKWRGGFPKRGGRRREGIGRH